jgi:hypothetical protein
MEMIGERLPMTAETAHGSIAAIDAAIAGATPGPGEDGQRLAAAVLRLLSAGEAARHAARAFGAGLA